MSSTTQAMLPIPAMYDMTNDTLSAASQLYASRSTDSKPFTSGELPRTIPGAPPASRSAIPPTATVTLKKRSATRSVSDVLDDILHAYTGVASWATFSQLQRDGAALRVQLQNGAVFEHAAVQPTIPPALTEWTRRLRSLQAGRVCAGGGDRPSNKGGRGPAGATRRSTVKDRSSRPSKCPPYSATTNAVGVAADTVSLAEKELDRIEAAESGAAEEDGLLPLWDDIEPTQRCGPAVLHALRAAVRTYYRALLALVTLAEQFVGRWGHLSPVELRELNAAMAREKAAHVPSGFLFSAFVELNASEERLDSAAGELAKCDHLTVLRLNRNPALAELDTLPPKCRVMMACGCRLHSFLQPSPRASSATTAPPLSYTSLTTLGLAYNELRDVKFIALLPSLVVLDASFNFMVDLDAVVRDVAAHDALAEVAFQGNPFSLLDTYRTTFVRGCMRLEKLDKVAINSEELALSYQRSQAGEREDAAAEVAGGEPSTTTAEARGAATAAGSAGSAPSRKAPSRKSANSKLALPVVNGSKDGRESGAPDDVGQTVRPRKGSMRKPSGVFTTSQVTLSSAAIFEGTQPPPPASSAATALTDEALRTTVAAEVELLVLRGLSSFESVVQTHTLEELLPTAPRVYELAGINGTDGAVSPLSRGVSVAAFSGAATPGQAAAGAPSPPSASSESKKGKGGSVTPAATAASGGAAATPAGATAGAGGGGGDSAGHGRLNTSPAPRGNAAGSNGVVASGKRVAVAPPLYELTSRICIQGHWGGVEDRGMSHSVSGASFHKKNGEDRAAAAGAGVRVDFSLELASPAPSTPHRGAARHGAAARRSSVESASRQRKRVMTTGGAPASSAAGVSAASANGNGSNSAVQDPFVLSGAAAAGGALGRRSSLSNTGVYTAQLPLTPDLVAGLQQPMVLRVVVEDTFRFVEGAALRALTEFNGGRGNSATRGGAPGSASGARAGREGTTPVPTRLTPAASLTTSPLPETALMSVLALGPKVKRDVADGVSGDDAVVECQRREIGVIRLNPFDLLYKSEGVSGGAAAAGPSAGQLASPVAAPTANPSTTTTSSGGAAVSSPASLPQSRVLFFHGVAMEVNATAVQAMQREVRQRQRQLQEALHTYHALREQCAEPAGEGRDGGLELAGGPSTAGDAFASCSNTASGQVSPRSGKRGMLSPPGMPTLPALAAATALTANTAPSQAAAAAAAGSKPTSRSSRVSVSPQHSTHLLHLHIALREQQATVVRLAVRVMALEARLKELEAATLSADARLSLGRGPPPPLTNAADAELDALRYRREAPATRKGRPQPPKTGRR